ncbi:MAG TPA: hypothetical protein VMW91_11210, partial [Desulfosporosinus sp.]|nr:hypothetical protein [Desulfosporosinus sp.]
MKFDMILYLKKKIFTRLYMKKIALTIWLLLNLTLGLFLSINLIGLDRVNAQDEEFDLTIAVTGSGSTSPAAGVHNYTVGTDVDVTATPDAGWVLDYWLLDSVNVGSANPYTVTMDANHSLTVVFAEILEEFDLTIAVTGSGSTSPAAGVHNYAVGTDVDVTATPDAGWAFDHWGLDKSNAGSANPYTVTMNDDHSLTAVFVDIPTYDL